MGVGGDMGPWETGGWDGQGWSGETGQSGERWLVRGHVGSEEIGGSRETVGQVRQVRSGEARETGEAGVSGKIGVSGGSVGGWVELVIIVSVGIGVLLQLYKLYLFHF